MTYVDWLFDVPQSGIKFDELVKISVDELSVLLHELIDLLLYCVQLAM